MPPIQASRLGQEIKVYEEVYFQEAAQGFWWKGEDVPKTDVKLLQMKEIISLARSVNDNRKFKFMLADKGGHVKTVVFSRLSACYGQEMATGPPLYFFWAKNSGTVNRECPLVRFVSFERAELASFLDLLQDEMKSAWT